MKKVIILSLIITIFSFSSLLAQIIFLAENQKPGNSIEIKKMQSEFQKNVDSMVLEAEYARMILFDVAEKVNSIGSNLQSQYFVYADRNPEKQIALVCFYDSMTRDITIIGASKISTGHPKPGDYFMTPTGIFENSVKNPSYRAMGTKNIKGWRGLGVKNSRAWDFGWQETEKNGQKAYIRLLMHATDPDWGEKRLGKIDSKGCVRISARLNKFLDHYGILDKDYEEHKDFKTVSWVLAKNRESVKFAGKYLIIGDSQEIDYIPESPAVRWEQFKLDPIINNWQ